MGNHVPPSLSLDLVSLSKQQTIGISGIDYSFTVLLLATT